MNKKYENMAMVDIAYELIKENKQPLAMQEIFESIAEIKNISLEDVEKLTQLYMNITESGKFVYCGDDKWDLKEGNLELWDADGSQFIQIIEEDDIQEGFIEDFDISALDVFDEEDDEDEIDEDLDDEDEDEELDEQTKKELEEEKEYIEVELPLHYSDDDDDDTDFDVDDYDEDDYNKIMDEFEDMYD